MKRGPYKKKECKLINFYLPETMLPFVDRAVRVLDTDRSKFIRQAIREKMAFHGVPMKDEPVIIKTEAA